MNPINSFGYKIYFSQNNISVNLKGGRKMRNPSIQNKKAWEYRAYEFWNKRDGTPRAKAEEILKDPASQLKKHAKYFKDINGKLIANLCGSNGRKAVPLALLGAEVTVFDISVENKRYAIELAASANTSIEYVVTDIYEINLDKYGKSFDKLYLEGGILHYFHDLHKFMRILFALLKDDGVMVLSDFHPFRKCIVQKEGKYELQLNYFQEEVLAGDLAYKHYFEEEEQDNFPDVTIKLYTLSDILNSLISSGFQLQKMEEHKGWDNENIPWEYTILAGK